MPGQQMPGQPMPWPPPGPGHRKPKSKAGLVLVALVLVVLLIGAAGGGMYYFQLGPFGSKISADRKLEYVLQERFAANYRPTEGSDILTGHWWTDKYLVRSMPNQIVAYDLANGSTAYTVDTPNHGLCKASGQQSSKGYIAVLRGTRTQGCRQVTVVDITNGKVVWSKNLPPAGAPRPDLAGASYFPRLSHEPAILGDRLYIPTEKGTHILKVSDGSTIGTPPDPKEGKCYTTYVDVIDTTGFAYRNCSRHGGREGLHLTAFNPAGKPIYQWKLPVVGKRPWMLAGVLSANPLVVRAYNQQQSQIWRVDPKTGKHNVVVDLYRISRGPAPGDPCAIAGSDGLYDCPGQLVANDVLYLQHRLGASTRSTELRQGIAAYDVRSGKQLWLREWGEDHDVTPPIGVDGDGAPVVYLLPKEKDPGAVVRVDPANSGKMTAIATLPKAKRPDSRSLIASPEPGGLAWHNNRLAFLRIQINVKDAGDDATTILR
ncbi:MULTISPECIES: hypothetical protein [unclassified Kribbella]|uniref:hypothetical protein n=1 Tax=unclassified Kribbella TaxID=2644121 RepID=UPI003017BBD8